MDLLGVGTFDGAESSVSRRFLCPFNAARGGHTGKTGTSTSNT